MRRVLVLAWLALSVAPAWAETIALLPLDSDKRLEIYSQPVAAEIARALKAAGLDVVVVSAKMEVPDTAQLIVDGTIKKAGKDIALSVRVRDPRDGSVVETLPASPTPLGNIDKAAAELSARLVPVVQAHLARLARPKSVDAPKLVDKPPETNPARSAALPLAVVVAAVAASSGRGPVALRDAIGAELPRWAHAQHRDTRLVAVEKLQGSTMVKTIVENRSDAAITLQVLAFEIKSQRGVPTARARVRLRIADPATVKFERVIRTDTIVGDRGMTDAALAARAAREVLAIARPNLRRTIATWQR